MFLCVYLIAFISFDSYKFLLYWKIFVTLIHFSGHVKNIQIALKTEFEPH